MYIPISLVNVPNVELHLVASDIDEKFSIRKSYTTIRNSY